MGPFSYHILGSSSCIKAKVEPCEGGAFLEDTLGDPLSLCGMEQCASMSKIYVLCEHKQGPKLTEGLENMPQSLTVVHMV